MELVLITEEATVTTQERPVPGWGGGGGRSRQGESLVAPAPENIEVHGDNSGWSHTSVTMYMFP